MNKLLTALTTLLISGIALAEEAEKPVETVGVGGIVAFLGICIAMAVVFVWYTKKSSSMTDDERSGDKLK